MCVTFKGSLREEAHSLLEKGKKTGAGIWLFGFHVGGSSEEYVKTEFDKVKWDDASGSIFLEPTKQFGYPTLLGFAGYRL